MHPVLCLHAFGSLAAGGVLFYTTSGTATRLCICYKGIGSTPQALLLPFYLDPLAIIIMPDPSVTASGERFARDMRRIREAHDVSREAIYDETMISVHLIESFEQDGLFEHPTFNRVYLRSFMRSYANAVGMNPDDALTHLERALTGKYANELAVEYLGDEPIEIDSVEETAEETVPDEADKEPSPDAPPDGSASPASPPGATASPTPPAEPAPAVPASASEDRDESDGTQQGVLIGIGIVLVIIIAWVLVDVFRSENTPERQTSPAVPADTADTTQLEPVDSLEADTPSVAIGDTMYFTVIAQEQLNPIRVRRDEDLRRPYYLNRGQAAVFPAQQQIVIDEGYDAIRLLINGHEYPAVQRVGTEGLVITRDTVQAFLDTTSTTPLSLVVPADTFPVLNQ